MPLHMVQSQWHHTHAWVHQPHTLPHIDRTGCAHNIECKLLTHTLHTQAVLAFYCTYSAVLIATPPEYTHTHTNTHTHTRTLQGTVLGFLCGPDMFAATSHSHHAEGDACCVVARVPPVAHQPTPHEDLELLPGGSRKGPGEMQLLAAWQGVRQLIHHGVIAPEQQGVDSAATRKEADEWLEADERATSVTSTKLCYCWCSAVKLQPVMCYGDVCRLLPRTGRYATHLRSSLSLYTSAKSTPSLASPPTAEMSSIHVAGLSSPGGGSTPGVAVK